MDEVEQDLRGLRPALVSVEVNQALLFQCSIYYPTQIRASPLYCSEEFDIHIWNLMIIKKVVGVTMVVLVSIWTGHCMGGFSGSDDANLVFNWHPLLMVISLVFLYGNGILVYRVARY